MDGFGRTIRAITGNGTTTVSTVDTVYVPCGCSPLGKVGQTSAPYAPSAPVYWTTYTYDGLGRTTQMELPDGSITHYSYSGNTVTVNDPAGKTKTFTIDALGNLTQVQEPDPNLGTVSTNYTYDMLNHLTQVSMPRGSNTQTRTFNYLTGTTVGTDLLSATNPENGTVTYTYNSDHTLHTKTDAKGQVFTYSYDSYKRLTQIMVGTTVLRNFIYDTNTLDNTGYSNYTQGRLAAVQNSAFTPQGYVPGQGGSNVTVPSNIQFIEMFNYSQAGLVKGKRLQVQETFKWYVNNVLQTSNQSINLDGTYTYDTGGEGKVLSVNYPQTYSWNGTGVVQTAGNTYTYSFDSMMRPTGLTDQNSNTLVSNVTYNAANQLLTFNTETHQYNNLNQMTRLTITGAQPLDISYNFPAGTNNGKIASQVDNLSGETVTYQYDSLNRLLSASSSQSWSETYGFDGFGNLLSKAGTGGAPTLSQSADPSTNRIVGQSYDSNGNQTSGPLGSVSYDAENRIASVSSAGVQYAYDSRNKRIWSSTLSGGNLTQTFYYYGIDGQKLGIYPLTLVLVNNVTPVMTDNSNVKLSTFFGRKRLGTFDRLGTAKYDQQNSLTMSFYPYGEDRGTVQPNDSLKFATYTRDSATGLDYADQRYYASNWGRFMSPDPYQASAAPVDSGSWNRYSYTRYDPTNRMDPLGREDCDPNDPGCGCDPDIPTCAAPPSTPGPPAIQCEIQVFSQSVDHSPYQHTVIEVEFAIGTSQENDWWVEGVPVKKDGSPGDPSVSQMLTGQAWLNILITPASLPSKYPASKWLIAQTGPSASTCLQAGYLISHAFMYQTVDQNTITYFPLTGPKEMPSRS
jgi:RHS repeat-associated protein